MNNSELIPPPVFMERTGYKKTQTYEIYKNRELVRLGILKKVTAPNKNGGWRIDWPKYLKWSDKNTVLVLGV